MLIDVEALRDGLLDLCGTAAFAGLGPALLDATDVEDADSDELVQLANAVGIDLREYEV